MGLIGKSEITQKNCKVIFLALAMAAVLSSCSALYFSSTVNQAVGEQKLLSFEDDGKFITLRTSSAGLNYLKQPKVNLSYIISIPSPLSGKASSVYLRFIDAQGFEIEEVGIGNVVSSYTGSLKGSISIDPAKYERIAGAEICLRTPLS